MAKSRINYAAVDTMSSNITSIKDEISNIFSSELCGKVVNSIAGHYNGDAAESYKNRFRELGEKANDSLSQVITTMTQKIDETKSAYQGQDQALS